MKFLKKSDALNYFKKCSANGANNLRLFQEDINRAGAKYFHVMKPTDVFHIIKQNKVSHFYEFWSDKCKLLFSLDIDMKVKSDYDYRPLIKNIIMNVKSGAKKYYNHQYSYDDIVVLQNDEVIQKIENPDKISFHIIFRGLAFENYLVCKDFFNRLSVEYNMAHCDKAIYKLTCFRLCFNSKMGRNAILSPIEFQIDSKYTTATIKDCDDVDTLKKFWLSTLITNVDSKVKLIDVSNVANKSILKPSHIIDYNDKAKSADNINIEEILFQLPANYYDDYDLWTKIGMILCNISSKDIDYYDLWNRWSQQSEKYKETNMITKWNSFKITNTHKNNIGLGTLIKWCKDEGIINIYKNSKKSVDSIVSDYIEREIIIDKKYMDKAIILNQKKLNPEIFEPYIGSGLLAIQSEKGTGKTSNLLEALFKSKNVITKDTSMLFISSRRTFGIKLKNDLEEFGFKLYSEITDPYITAKRIICQIDSITRLDRDKYDYVIIDECESLARYITSSHFSRNSKAGIIVSTLEMRADDADHLYIMDADLSDRCINYYTKIREANHKSEKLNLIVNQFKPYSDYTIEYMSYEAWLNIIMNDIEINKKLVIPMASNSKAKDLTTKINRDFPEKKVLLIHKETSDEEKLIKLLKVNEEWNTYDVVIYTPSVCMGVSFDVPNYFDNIYAYGCSNSLGSQEFCQMIHRVRTPKNNKIYLAMDFYKEMTLDDLIDYKTVEQMLCSDYYLTSYDLHNNILPKKVKKIVNTYSSLDDGIENDCQEAKEDKTDVLVGETVRDRILSYPHKEEPIYDLYVRNSWESIEDKLNFPSKFFGYVKHKAYQLIYHPNDGEINGEVLKDMKNIREERTEEDNNNTVEGIISAPDLLPEDYSNKIKQKDEYLDEKDIYAIKRFNIVKCYGLKSDLEELNKNEEIPKTLTDIITKEFVSEFNDKTKMGWFRNISTVLNSNMIGKDGKTYSQNTSTKLAIMKDNAKYDAAISNCYTDFTMRNKYSYHFYALEIIHRLGFDINNLDVEQYLSTLLFLIDDCLEWAQQHKLEIIYKYDMLKYTHKDLKAFDKFNDKLKFINNILESQYGLKIKKKNTSQDPEKMKYCLTDNDVWQKSDGSKIKLKPIQLFSKREDFDKYRDHDNSNLDDGIFLDEE